MKGNDKNIDLEKIKKDLQGSLSEYRYQHCLRVAEEARKLAIVYHYDSDRAYLAGLLHDIAKEFNGQENKEIIDKCHADLGDILAFNSGLIHAEVGAMVVSLRYGLDEEICHAIRVHTIGDFEMNLLDKIIYVADKIEPGKDFFDIEEERRLAYQDIDKALLLCMENYQQYLRSRGKNIYPKLFKILDRLRS